MCHVRMWLVPKKQQQHGQMTSSLGSSQVKHSHMIHSFHLNIWQKIKWPCNMKFSQQIQLQSLGYAKSRLWCKPLRHKTIHQPTCPSWSWSYWHGNKKSIHKKWRERHIWTHEPKLTQMQQTNSLECNPEWSNLNIPTLWQWCINKWHLKCWRIHFCKSTYEVREPVNIHHNARFKPHSKRQQTCQASGETSWAQHWTLEPGPARHSSCQVEGLTRLHIFHGQCCRSIQTWICNSFQYIHQGWGTIANAWVYQQLSWYLQVTNLNMIMLYMKIMKMKLKIMDHNRTKKTVCSAVLHLWAHQQLLLRKQASAHKIVMIELWQLVRPWQIGLGPQHNLYFHTSVHCMIWSLHQQHTRK